MCEQKNLRKLWRLRWAQAFSTLFRVRTLQRAERLFEGAPQDCVLSRKFCGYRLYLEVARSATHQMLYLEGERQVPERGLIRSVVDRGMRVVDVGANIGYYLLLLEESVGAGGEIVCLEPGAANLVELRRNIAANYLTNVRVLEIAAGRKSQRLSLKEGLNARVTDGETDGVPVRVEPLDAVLTGRVDFIKIDVEGYEWEVLLGTGETIERDYPVLMVEIHPGRLARYGSSAAAVLEWMRERYPSVRLYAMRDALESGRIARVWRRYVRGGNICALADLAAFTQRCPDGGTFWAVASESRGRDG